MVLNECLGVLALSLFNLKLSGYQLGPLPTYLPTYLVIRLDYDNVGALHFKLLIIFSMLLIPFE